MPMERAVSRIISFLVFNSSVIFCLCGLALRRARVGLRLRADPPVGHSAGGDTWPHFGYVPPAWQRRSVLPACWPQNKDNRSERVRALRAARLRRDYRWDQAAGRDEYRYCTANRNADL